MTKTRRAFTAAAAIVALAAALWAVVGSAWILPELSANSDEGLYLLQADALAEGRLAPVAPEHDAEAHLPWFSVARDGRYVLKYAPVHASVLAAAEVVSRSTRAALGAIAAAQVLLVIALARELGASRRAALVAGGLFATAPLVLQLDITYLPYGTSVSLLLAAATAGWRAHRRSSRPWAIVAGACWGLAAFARPYDAVLFGAALAGALLLRHHRLPSDDRPPLGRLTDAAALGAVVPLAGLLAFNHTMTGDALQLPFHLMEPRDAPGLGLRRSLPSDGYLDYTLARAASSLGRNLLLVAVWSAGGLLGGGLAAATLVRRRLDGAVLLLAVLVVWPIGYALFWGSYVAAYLWDGALFLGPFYYLPMVAVLAVAAGVGLDDLWRWRPSVGAVAALGAVVLSAGVAVPRLAAQQGRTEPREAVADAMQTIDGPSLVFVPPLYGPYLQNPLSFLRNDADLGGSIVYALDRGDAANDRVRAAYPGRAVYRLELPNGWNDQPGFEPGVHLERLPDEGAR